MNLNVMGDDTGDVFGRYSRTGNTSDPSSFGQVLMLLLLVGMNPLYLQTNILSITISNDGIGIGTNPSKLHIYKAMIILRFWCRKCGHLDK